MSGVIANALDETGKFTVVAPSHLPVTNVNANTPIKSDVRAAVEVVCSAAKLNYAVFGTKDEMSIGAPSISMFGVGRPAKSVMFGLRVYDCKTGAIVWDSLVAIEDHQPIWDTAQSGVFTFYTGDSPSVGSKVIVAKMMSDLGW
jgi:hypothetical protein